MALTEYKMLRLLLLQKCGCIHFSRLSPVNNSRSAILDTQSLRVVINENSNTEVNSENYRSLGFNWECEEQCVQVMTLRNFRNTTYDL